MAFTYKLERENGTPADATTYRSAVLNWKAGDTIPLGERILRVVAVRDDDADQACVLVVEDAVPERRLTIVTPAGWMTKEEATRAGERGWLLI